MALVASGVCYWGCLIWPRFTRRTIIYQFERLSRALRAMAAGLVAHEHRRVFSRTTVSKAVEFSGSLPDMWVSSLVGILGGIFCRFRRAPRGWLNRWPRPQ